MFNLKPKIIQLTINFNNQLARCHKAACDSPRIAVILSGCGVHDGSEIHEAVSVLSQVSRNGGIPKCFAPNIKQSDVINHLTEEIDPDSTRNVLLESCRIERSNAWPLSKLIETQENYAALIFPGGFGVVKNLCDFAKKGIYCSVLPEIEKIIKDFHTAKKPIGLCCIAPVLAARVLCNITITLGKQDCDKWPYRSVIDQVKQMGAIIENRDWFEVSVDRENLIFSTPAFMYCGKYHEIDDGIGNMIKYILSVINSEQKK